MTLVSQRRPPLIQYWHAEQPPDYIVELLDTFREHNPDMEHLVFNRSTAADFIAANYGNREVAAFNACAVPAMQADYFRYCACHTLGGICVDADFRCHGPLQPLFDSATTGMVLRYKSTVLLANGLFGFLIPGHSLLEITLRMTTELIQRRVRAKAGQITGPRIFTSLFCLYQIKSLEAAYRCAAGTYDLSEGDLLDGGLTKEVQQVVSGDWKGTAEVVKAAHSVISDRTELTAAFDGVRLVPSSEVVPSLIEHVEELPYKETPAHWPLAGTDVYKNVR